MKPQQLDRQIRAQRRAVLSDAVAHLRGLGSDELTAVLGRLLAAVGLVDVTLDAENGDEVTLSAALPIGSSRLPVLVCFRRQRAVVDAGVLEAFRGRAAGRYALGLIVATTRSSRDALDAGQSGSPPVAIVDAASLAELLEESCVLVEPTDGPVPLRLSTKRAVARRAPTPVVRDDGRGRAPRLFRWRLDTGADGTFVLHADYLPDPSLSFVVNGTRVGAIEDFLPARTALHQAICRNLRTIFPDLSPARIRTKAWPGVHRVYTVREYGSTAKERRE